MTVSALELFPCRDPRVLAQLSEQIDALAGTAMDAIVREIPYYRTLESQQLGEVRRIAVAGTAAFLPLWGQGRLARPEELAPFRAHGAARAAEGRPLTFVLRAYRVAGRILLDYAVRAGGEDVQVADVANLAQLVLGFIDQLSDVVTEGYVEASEHLASGPERARRELFEDLIAGRFASAEGVKDRAHVLGFTLLDAPRVLVATLAEGGDPPLPERVARLHAELSVRATQPLLLISRERLVTLADIDDDTLERGLSTARLRGAVARAATLAEVPDAYRRALKIVELLEHGRVPARTLIAGPEADLLLHLSGASTSAEDPYAPILGRLLDHRNRHLIEALRAFFDLGNAVSAAHALGVHPQTMRNRLRRVRQLTGRDPSLGWDRFLLEIALRARALRAV